MSRYARIRSGQRLTSTTTVVITAAAVVAGAAAIPIAATTQRLAAVVRPANREPLTDDRARPEEADPGHDLRRDPRRVVG